ncbi:hypothetical protein ACFQBQ_03670 [Granulicella cerasi]|uniref:Ig-like domain-containing protein n=1 Tax=Granulicella cerasi TaxID=741063 RepID=A0ABW1Z6K8_9BACT|nr:hypothetical protein [Granulicella cerasi]
MSQRRFRNIGRYALAACAVSLGSASLIAQTAAPSGTNPSRADVFLGYSYMGNHGVVKPSNIRFSSVDVGAIGSGAYYFNKYAGLEVVAVANPDGQNDGFYSGYAGPIFRAPMQNFTLFAHGLAGGIRGGGPNSEVPATLEHEPWTWGAGLMVGGGMDYDLPFFNHMFGIRLFEADYRYTHLNYGPATTIPTAGNLGGRANLGSAELSSGILMHFGHIVPPPPVTYACAVTAPTGTIYPGDVITVTGTATNLNPKKDAAYTWTSDAGPVAGTSNVASVDTKTLSAGTYTVKGHVSQGMKPGQFSDCSATFTVTAFQPPTVGCSATPSTVNPGDPSTITANGVSPQNRPLTYSYSATAGTVSGNTSTATLQTTGVAPGTITVTCNVVDDKGQTASQMTTVTVSAPPPAPVVTKSLCTITFDKDKKRPTRVDNEAKACLDDIALSAQRDPQSKLAVIGSSEPTEKMPDHKAAERAVNEKEYLVVDKGLDASRISVYTGAAGTKSSATTLIPVGATLDMTGLTPVDEAKVKAVPRTAHMAHKKHHHKM